MLVLHPNSTCDVCLDNYSNGAHSPHAIACGHVFCQGCIDSLSKPICPLCRTKFEPQDIRKLHIDRGQTPRIGLMATTETPKSNSEIVEYSHEARRYQTDITRIVRVGAPASELRTLIDQCHIWLKSQPNDQYEDLRVSFLLLYNLTETQCKLAAETEAVRGFRTECEKLRAQIVTERDAAERRYAELERSSIDEKETALAIEKSLRDHYRQLDDEWRRQYAIVLSECRRLEDDLKNPKYPLPEAPRPADIRYFYTSENRMDTSGADEQFIKAHAISEAQIRKLGKDDMFHLSPLPANIPPLPSAVLGFSALAEDDDDFKKVNDKSFNDAKAVVYDISNRSAVEPIPIPTNPHAPRVSSGLALSVPKTIDPMESGVPRLPPKTQDVTMGNCSSSPTADHPSRDRRTPSQTTEPKAREPSLGRQYIFNEERRARDPVDQRERRRQLHDLLDSPMSSSLPTNSQLQSILSETSPTRLSPVRDTQPTSQNPTPSNPVAIMKSSANNSIPLSSSLGQGHGHHMPTRPPLISHASSAAVQLERERLRAEKEREKERESNREREQERERERDRRQAGSTSSLRDTTNAYHRGAGNGKGKVQIYA